MNHDSNCHNRADTAVQIRGMRPDDAAAVVALHLAAMPDFFLTSLGPRFLRTYYTRLIADSTAIAEVAVDSSGLIVGATVGSTNPAGFYSRLLKGSWWRFGWAALSAVIQSPRALPRVFRAVRYPASQPTGERVAGLYSIVVVPRAQGQGVGRAMIREFLDTSRAKGSASVYLHADAVGNEHWNNLLRRTGWKLEREFVTPEGRPMNEYWFDLEEQ